MWVVLHWLRFTDQNTCWTPIQFVSCSSLFEQIKSTDQNGWTPIQQVSHSPVFEQIRSTDHNGWTSRMWVALHCNCLSRLLVDPLLNTHPASELLYTVWADRWQMPQIHWPGWTHPSRLWVALQCLSRWDPLTRMAEHPSSEWVTLHCLSRSDALTRMVEHPSRLWVALNFLSRSDLLTRMAEHPFSEWVVLWCLSRSDPLTRVADHPSSKWVTLQCLSRSELGWWEWLSLAEHKSSMWVPSRVQTTWRMTNIICRM